MTDTPHSQDDKFLDLARELGGVDKVPDPETDGCDEDEAEEAVGGLVVSGCQSSAVFQL